MEIKEPNVFFDETMLDGPTPDKPYQEPGCEKCQQLRNRLTTLEAAKEHHVANLTRKLREQEVKINELQRMVDHWGAVNYGRRI